MKHVNKFNELEYGHLWEASILSTILLHKGLLDTSILSFLPLNHSLSNHIQRLSLTGKLYMVKKGKGLKEKSE